MKFSVPRGMATGNASLTHENLATSAKFNAYNSTERVRDPGAEDADVSSQSSSSSVIPRCGAKFQSNLGKVNLSEVQYANKPYYLLNISNDLRYHIFLFLIREEWRA